MANVRIDDGPLSATYRFSDVARNRWQQLVGEKRNFLATKIRYDCRCLIEFCEEANEVWHDLGYGSAADMIRNGYELDPQQIELAVAWLKINEPDAAIGISDVSKKVREAKETPLGSVGAPEGNSNARKAIEDAKKAPINVDNINIESRQVKGGTSAEYLLRRLARDCPEMLDRIEAGELSVHAAAVEAGIRKVKSPEDKTLDAFRKCENRLTVLHRVIECLEPHEIQVVRDWLQEHP